MKPALKRALLVLAGGLGAVWSIVPFRLRRLVIGGLMVLESRTGRPDGALGRLFAVADDLDRVIAERATALGDGVNPKHRLSGYHDFFVERIPPASKVLDLGSGIGALGRSIAERVPGVEVLGIESDPAVLARARDSAALPNLTFRLGDIEDGLEDGHWDVIVLSGVLEHLERRVQTLCDLVRRHTPDRILIRVPVFERHWHMALRRELGAGYLSDPDHKIEYTLAEFAAEMEAAGLRVVDRKIRWGEIWAECRPEDRER